MAKRENKSKTDGESGTITDIAHEEVKNSPGQMSVVPKVDNPEEQIKQEIAKFNIADSAIAKMKEAYSGLMIAGQEDKEGYKAVKEAWQEVRTKRTGLEKKGLELRNRYKVVTTAIGKEEDRLIELITPLEDDLYKKWKAIDEEKERVKKEREAEEQKQLMARVEEVMNLGMTLRDGFYVIGETISMDVATLRALPEDQYDRLKGQIRLKAAEIKKASDDAAAERKRQADELRQQQDALRVQQEEMRKQKDELKRQQDELYEQQANARKDNLRRRADQLFALGMKFNFQHDAYVFEDVNVDNKTEICLFNDKEWDELIKKITPVIADRKKAAEEKEKKQAQENEARETKKKFIAEKMEAAGFAFSYTAQAFQWENDIDALSVSFGDLLAIEEAAIENKAQDMAAKRFDSMAKSATLKKEREFEQEKANKLAMNDKQRWAGWLSDIALSAGMIQPGEFKTKAFQDKATNLIKQITLLLKENK